MACEAMVASALFCQYRSRDSMLGTGYARCLVVLAAGPHDDVGGRRSRVLGLVVRVVALVGRLGEAEDGARDATEIAARIGPQGAKQALAGFLGQVGLLEDALGGVDVRQVHDGGRVARVENSRQPHAGLQRLDDAEVNLVVDDVAGLLEVDGVDDLVVAVVFVAVEVLGLPAVAWCEGLASDTAYRFWGASRSHQSSAGTGRRWAGRP